MRCPFRLLARVVLEAETPIVIGSGEKNGLTDSLVLKDVNALPYIPASTLAGCLRHAVSTSVDKNFENDLFGFQNGDNGRGSRFIFTDGRMIGKDGLVIDGLTNIDFESDSFYRHFAHLPIRDHVRISHQGAAEKGGKFDEEIVFKGSRFCFEVELLGVSEADFDWMQLIMQKISESTFRIGGGSRSGFGKVKVVDQRCAKLDLNEDADLNKYLGKSSDLSDPVEFWKSIGATRVDGSSASGWTSYSLNLKAEDFFLFASGAGDDDADICNAMGTQIEWRNDKPYFSENLVLIPGSSVKGALSHRVAFIYNKLKGVTAESIKQDAENVNVTFQEKAQEYIGDKNKAVHDLFGSQKQEITAGSVLISDVMQKGREGNSTKLMNHVSVDRFTGGAVDGALFAEKPWASDKKEFDIDFMVKNSALEDVFVKGAFEGALKEIACGMLPLGGGVNRGHGIFKGKVLRNGEAI